MELKEINWTDEQWNRCDTLAKLLNDLDNETIVVNWVEDGDAVLPEDNKLTWVAYNNKEDYNRIIEAITENGFIIIDDDYIYDYYYLYIEEVE